MQVLRFVKEAVPYGQQAQLASSFVQDVLVGFWLSRPARAEEEGAEEPVSTSGTTRAPKGGGNDFFKFDFLGEDEHLKTLPVRYYLPPDADSKMGAHFLDARQKDAAGELNARADSIIISINHNIGTVVFRHSG